MPQSINVYLWMVNPTPTIDTEPKLQTKNATDPRHHFDVCVNGIISISLCTLILSYTHYT